MADTAVTISHQNSDQRGRYLAKVSDSDAEGELTWQARSPGVRVADHTFVPPELRGRGIAGELVQALIADARDEGFKIVPACSYVAKAFEDHPEWSDLKA